MSVTLKSSILKSVFEIFYSDASFNPVNNIRPNPADFGLFRNVALIARCQGLFQTLVELTYMHKNVKFRHLKIMNKNNLANLANKLENYTAIVRTKSNTYALPTSI